MYNMTDYMLWQSHQLPLDTFANIASACGEPVCGSYSSGCRTRVCPDSRKNAAGRVSEPTGLGVANAKPLIGLMVPAIRTDGRPDSG
jgi:hypothetical protein